MKLKIISLLRFYNIAISQNKPVYVEYEITIIDQKNVFKNNAALRQMLDSAVQNDQNVSFGLLINGKGSKFYETKNLSYQDFSTNSIVLSFASFRGDTYTLEKNNFVKYDMLGSCIYVRKQLVENWILHNETKTINNYICYKATNENKIINNEKTVKHDVIAWYYPKLPYSY